MRNLIIVPTGGEESFIESWMAGAPSYHLMLLDHSANGDSPCHFAHYVHKRRGFKTELLWDAVVTHGELIDSYDAVWLPDGDLAIEPSAIEAMFALFHELKLCLAQPSVIGPNVNVPVTGRCRWTQYRYTDFVEVMCPLLTPWALHLIKDTFPLSRSAWGQDWVWADRLPSGTVAIFDRINVFHSKPCCPDGPLYKTLAGLGESPCDDVQRLRGRYQSSCEMRTLRWVFARAGGWELGIGRLRHRPARSNEVRSDVSERPPGLTVVVHPSTQVAALPNVLLLLSGYGPNCECLVPPLLRSEILQRCPEGLPALREISDASLAAGLSAAGFDRVLFTRGKATHDWLVGALDRLSSSAGASATSPGEDLLVCRKAWAKMVNKGFVARLAGTAAEASELAAALLLGGWTVENSWPGELRLALQFPWVDAEIARELGQASVWMDAYLLIDSWPFRDWRQRLTLHWPYHLARELVALAKGGLERYEYDYRWARAKALLSVGFRHSAWVKQLRHACWRGANKER